jgi:hypothetical protein
MLDGIPENHVVHTLIDMDYSVPCADDSGKLRHEFQYIGIGGMGQLQCFSNHLELSFHASLK